MIHEAMTSIAGELNRFLQSKHNINEEKVILSNVLNVDGSIAIQETDKIVMSVANIETDKSQSSTSSYKQNTKGNFTMVKPSVNVNITVMFSAYFTPENYVEGLKFISSVVAFFQFKSGTFTPQDTPALIDNFDRLTMELISLDFRDLSNFWSMIGSKYMPSVLYRLKTVPIRHDAPTTDIPFIKKI